MAFTPDPKPAKSEKTKMTSSEFRKKYGRKKSLRSTPIKKVKRSGRDKAKAAFQKWIRFRDSNEQGICFCITCNRATIWDKNTDGGHFRPAHLEPTCFDERNCNAQCKVCNMTRMQTSELIDKYAENIDLKWGEGTAEELRINSLVTTSKRHDYKFLEKHYKMKYKNEIK